VRQSLHNLTTSTQLLFVISVQSTTHLQGSKLLYCFTMPPKSSVIPKAATSVLKSPPKTRRSTQKRAQSSTDTTVEPPVKKVATGDGEEEKGESRPKKGKGVRGKGIRCANNQFMTSD